jgi:hypothetical protein
MKIKGYIHLSCWLNGKVYNGYQPVKAELTLVSDYTFTNTERITFPRCNAGTSIIDYVELKDKRGTVVYSGLLDKPLAVHSCEAPEFAIGNLVISTDKRKK